MHLDFSVSFETQKSASSGASRACHVESYLLEGAVDLVGALKGLLKGIYRVP